MVAPATGSPAESFRLAPEKISGKQAVRASASDSRGLVYGMIAGTLGIVAIVLVAILAVRALSYLPLHSASPNTHGRAVWVADPEGNIVELNQGYVDEENPPPLIPD